jgi:molecular chaperone GrpE
MVGGEDENKDSVEIQEDSSELESQSDEVSSETESSGHTDELSDETAELIAEAVADALADQKDTVLRAHAEVQNMRKRCESDVERAHKFALEKFSAELFTVMDNLERALQAVPDTEHESVMALCEGVGLTLKSFIEIFGKFNIEQIDPLGEPFDPQLHEAMSMQENDEVEPNTVIAVMQKGYKINGRLIRPAMVLVSKSS